MARPAWTNIAATDIDVDSPGKTDTLFVALNNNTASARIALFGVDVPEDTSTAGAMETVANSSFSLYIPSLGDYTGIARKITLTVETKVASGDTGSFRMYNITNTTAGDTLTDTTTSYSDTELTLDIVDGWKGTTIDCRLEFYRSAGSTGAVSIQAPNSMTGRIEF